MSVATVEKPRKTEYLTKQELRAFRNHFKSFLRQEDASKTYGVTIKTLVDLSIKGHASPLTIQKVREHINVSAA